MGLREPPTPGHSSSKGNINHYIQAMKHWEINIYPYHQRAGREGIGEDSLLSNLLQQREEARVGWLRTKPCAFS
jgi:hypothetical protein